MPLCYFLLKYFNTTMPTTLQSEHPFWNVTQRKIAHWNSKFPEGVTES